MISWIQKTFQQHFRIVFGVLLAVVIVSFIFTIGAAPGIGRGDRKILSRPFFGLNLSSQADQQRIFGDANLSALLKTGYSSFEGAELQEIALQRQAALTFADRLNVPQPTQDEITNYVKGLRAFAGQNGLFDPKRYSDFRDSLKTNSKLKEGDVSRVLAEDIRVDKAKAILGGPGYALPSDVKTQLTLADSSWTIAIATLDSASFNPTITPTDAAITKYFEDNAFRYEIPPKVAVSYANFPATDYMGEVTLTEQDLRSFYDSNPARFPKPDAKIGLKPDAKPPTPNVPALPTNPDADFSIVRPQVEAALRLERAARLAAKAASDFTVALYEKRLKPKSSEFTSFLAGRKIALKDAPAFSRESPPPEFAQSTEIAEQAFSLNNDHYFSDAIATPNGSLVLFWKESIPSRQPSLTEVREKVTADYIAKEKEKRFADLGKTARGQLEAKLKSGTAFDKAVAEVATANNVKIEAKTYPSFTLRQRPQDIEMNALNTLDSLKKGELSEMVTSQGKGEIVYAVDKKVPDLSEGNPQYVSTRDRISLGMSFQNSQEYLREIVERELAKTTPATP